MKTNWKLKNVSDFGKIITGSTPSTKINEFWSGEFPFFSPADFGKNKYCEFTERTISGKGLETGRPLKKDSILFTCIGSIGKMAISGKVGISNQQINAIEVDVNNDFEFIYYLLELNKELFKNIAPMTTIQIINKSDFGAFRFPVPPLDHQRKIAKILNTADAVIERTEAAIAKYRAIKQGMMQDLFTRGIDLQTGQLRPAFKDAPHLYKETELGWIPKEWEVKKLDQLSESYAGGTPNRSIAKYFGGTIPWVSSGEVNAEFIESTKENITHLGLNSSSAKLVPSNSILIAMYGATAGQVSFLKIQATTNQAVLAIIPKERLNNIFLFYLLKKLKSKIIYLAQGSGQPNLSKNLVEKTLIVKPIIEEQEIIAFRFKKIDKLIEKEQANLAKHQSLKKGLMQDLLTGKVEV